eukprot:GEMP01045068.1.p1 GENE.GEMP01045068.1~~GEMP01045068.1.p1  ORF type:complete len:252 (+),score=61.98 GEMP01045068.1:123-878(+)
MMLQMSRVEKIEQLDDIGRYPPAESDTPRRHPRVRENVARGHLCMCGDEQDMNAAVDRMLDITEMQFRIMEEQLHVPVIFAAPTRMQKTKRSPTARSKKQYRVPRLRVPLPSYAPYSTPRAASLLKRLRDICNEMVRSPRRLMAHNDSQTTSTSAFDLARNCKTTARSILSVAELRRVMARSLFFSAAKICTVADAVMPSDRIEEAVAVAPIGGKPTTSLLRNVRSIGMMGLKTLFDVYTFPVRKLWHFRP